VASLLPPDQALAEGFAERAAGLVDLNERALTLRTGGLRGEDDDAGPRGGGYQDGGQGGFSGGRGCVPTMRACMHAFFLSSCMRLPRAASPAGASVCPQRVHAGLSHACACAPLHAQVSSSRDRCWCMQVPASYLACLLSPA
jgi:hypothetical protein